MFLIEIFWGPLGLSFERAPVTKSGSANAHIRANLFVTSSTDDNSESEYWRISWYGMDAMDLGRLGGIYGGEASPQGANDGESWGKGWVSLALRVWGRS